MFKNCFDNYIELCNLFIPRGSDAGLNFRKHDFEITIKWNSPTVASNFWSGFNALDPTAWPIYPPKWAHKFKLSNMHRAFVKISVSWCFIQNFQLWPNNKCECNVVVGEFVFCPKSVQKSTFWMKPNNIWSANYSFKSFKMWILRLRT